MTTDEVTWFGTPIEFAYDESFTGYLRSSSGSSRAIGSSTRA
jgi:hypothetical protein